MEMRLSREGGIYTFITINGLIITKKRYHMAIEIIGFGALMY
ncbi:hypothetical protein SLEP1_g52176 [Rubroshorea leprosula]|uniref:Uncharacterized protein n=1 Tax=Rubroshorea leprosula TaxID=152421 RepID=A0AAV5M837_9ROSI|nr:hypothetical protein SLEP1_g52176 [Rubroshorea leprosula]